MSLASIIHKKIWEAVENQPNQDYIQEITRKIKSAAAKNKNGATQEELDEAILEAVKATTATTKRETT